MVRPPSIHSALLPHGLIQSSYFFPIIPSTPSKKHSAEIANVFPSSPAATINLTTYSHLLPIILTPTSYTTWHSSTAAKS